MVAAKFCMDVSSELRGSVARVSRVVVSFGRSSFRSIAL